MPDKLPEEFAPQGPKLTRLPLRPPPPVLPRLFPDEARFAARLALLAGATELAFWAWLLRMRGGAALAMGALRCARLLWAGAGARVPRPPVAFGLLALALLAQGLAVVTIGQIPAFVTLAALGAALPALGDLAATCIADSVTVERRAAAFARLDMGQGLGCALGVTLAVAAPHLSALVTAAVLLAAGLCVTDLHDRGTPRSAWPARSYGEAARTPLAARLLPAALAIGALAAPVFRPLGETSFAALAPVAPLAGMWAAARLEPRMRNAVALPGALALLAAAALALSQLALRLPPSGWPVRGVCAAAAGLAIGGACSALPAAVARGAGELERPLVSSLCWAALALGAAVGCALSP